MKKRLLLMVALFMGTIACYGQFSKAEIEKMAEEQSIEMGKDGWKAKIGSMPLKQQLIKLYSMMEEDANGQSKYIIAEGQVQGATFETAKVHAMEIAKRNMVSLIDNVTVTETDGNTINVEGSEGPDGENLAETKYKNTSTLELGNLLTVLSCYRQIPGGKVEVMVQLACTRDNAVKAKLRKVKAADRPQNDAQKITTTHTL